MRAKLPLSLAVGLTVDNDLHAEIRMSGIP
jgi:hypothetical protein